MNPFHTQAAMTARDHGIVNRYIEHKSTPALIAAMLLLTGCSGGLFGGGDSDRPQPVPVTLESAPNVPAIDPDLVEIRYEGERSPSTIALIAPDGTSTAARDVERTSEITADEYNFPDIRVGVDGGSSSGVHTGIGIGFPIFGTGKEAAPPRTVTIARFQPPDIAHYRANWKRYRVELLFAPGTDDFERIELLAPEPADLPPLTTN
jgi:hypothetical protein